MPSPRMPIRLSPTSPQRHPRSRSSSPTRRERLSPTSKGPRTRILPNGRPFSPIIPGSQGSQRVRPAQFLKQPRSPSPQRIIEKSVHDHGGGLLATSPGARVVDRKQCEREISRAVVVTTELYDVHQPAPVLPVLQLSDCHIASFG